MPSRIALATSVASARVGSRLVVMDSSIWVAVMTGLPDAVGLGDQLLLDHGDFLDRNLHAEVAARHHDAVGRGEDARRGGPQGVGAFDLGDDERVAAEAAAASRTASTSAAVLDERLAHRVHPVLECELETRAVAVGERADAEVDPRQVESLPRSQLAADGDAAMNLASVNAVDRQLHQTVVEEQAIPGLHHRRKALEAHRHPPRIADHLLGGEREPIARHQLDRLRLDHADPHLRPGQVRHDGHPAPGRLLGRTDAGDPLGMVAETAVRKVQPRDVHPGPDEPPEHIGRLRCRADGGNDLRLVRRKIHGRAEPTPLG